MKQKSISYISQLLKVTNLAKQFVDLDRIEVNLQNWLPWVLYALASVTQHYLHAYTSLKACFYTLTPIFPAVLPDLVSNRNVEGIVKYSSWGWEISAIVNRDHIGKIGVKTKEEAQEGDWIRENASSKTTRRHKHGKAHGGIYQCNR